MLQLASVLAVELLWNAPTSQCISVLAVEILWSAQTSQCTCCCVWNVPA
jgi:hypothetical protein